MWTVNPLPSFLAVSSNSSCANCEEYGGPYGHLPQNPRSTFNTDVSSPSSVPNSFILHASVRQYIEGNNTVWLCCFFVLKVNLQDQDVLEKILRHVGLVRLDSISAVSAITWLSPEVIMLISSVALLITSSKLVRPILPEDGNEEGEAVPKLPTKKRSFSFLVTIGIS